MKNIKSHVLLLNILLLTTPLFGKTTFFPKPETVKESNKLTLTVSHYYRSDSQPAPRVGQFVDFRDLIPKSVYLDILQEGSEYDKKTAVKPVKTEVSDAFFTWNLAIYQPEKWEETFSKHKDNLTFEEKIRVVAAFGKNFEQNHNWSNVRDRLFNNANVTTENLLHAIKENEEMGVCSDFALAQSEMLQVLGVDKKDIYLIAYSAYGLPHVNLAVTNPADGSIVKLDYNYVTTSGNSTGSTALNQDNYRANSGIAFRVYDHQGEPLYQLTSDVGKLLQDVTGELTDTAASKSYSLSKTTIANKDLSLTFFNGKTFSKDKIKGVNVTKKFDTFNTALSLAYIHHSKNGSVDKLKQEAVFIRMVNDVKLITKTVNDDMNFSVGLEADTQLLYTLKNNGADVTLIEDFPKADLTVNLTPYISHEHSRDNGDTLNIKLSANSYIDMKNIRGPYVGANLAPTIGSVNLRAAYKMKNSLEVSGEFQKTKLGDLGRLNLSFEPDTQTRHELSLSGSLTSDAPAFMPGAGTKKEYTLTKKGLIKNSTIEMSAFSTKKRNTKDKGLYLELKLDL